MSELVLRSVIREIVRKQKCKNSKGKQGNYVLKTKKKPHEILGCHTTKKNAINQEKAIKASGG